LETTRKMKNHENFLFALPALKDLQSINNCYLSLGRESFPHAKNFLTSALQRWRNPVMSPRIALTNNIQLITNESISIFKTAPAHTPFDCPHPYFNLLLPEGNEVPDEWNNTLLSKGFALKKKLTFVLFDEQINYQLPSGFSFLLGTPFNKRIKSHFLNVMLDAFSMKDKLREELFWQEIFKALPTIFGKTNIVAIETSRGKPAGAGLVTYTSKGAYFWCGGIKTFYQGRGLFRPLIGMKQLLSSRDGCKLWMYSTSNSRIEKFGDRRFKDFSYTLTKDI
jgi:hypothetical protein